VQFLELPLLTHFCGGLDMSPKFYSFLWVVVASAAGVLWLGNVFTMLTAVVFGFISFGLVFVGMMCVLPGTVSHPTIKHVPMPSPEKGSSFNTRPVEVSNGSMNFPVGMNVHRTARF